MSKNFSPMLLTSLKTYNKEKFFKDLIAGIIVAIIALPLSIALALASGVGPEQGIYTAITAGFVVSLLGGSAVQIAGPTAAFATIVAGIVATEGIEGLAIATILAGVILVLMGVCRLGSLIKYIPFTITTGFTAGIAVTIAIGQLKDFCGVVFPTGAPTIQTTDKLAAFFGGIATVNPDALLVGGVCLAILILSPRIFKKIPGSLIAVVVGILMVKFLPLKVNTIGDLYTISNALPSFHLPRFTFSSIRTALPNALTIAFLAGIESLLSCVVADGMTGTKHRSNTELIAQGLGNLVSALFGGIPATGAIARTAANIKNGGRSPIAGIVHAITLLLVLVVLMPYAGLIPMPTIAAILFIVAYNMCQWRTFVKVVKKAPKSDAAVMALTFVLTVVFDLVVAIGVGMFLACLLFMKRVSDETGVRQWVPFEEGGEESLRPLPESIKVCEISGPLFFGSADQFVNIALAENTRCVILRMRSVSAIDVTAMNAMTLFCDRCDGSGVTVILSHLNKQPTKALEKAGLLQRVGKENICPNIDAAIRRAEQLTGAVEAQEGEARSL